MSFSIESNSTEDWWYILFENPKGRKCYLPTSQKSFGKWDVDNCHKCYFLDSTNAYKVQYSLDKTQAEVLSEFEQKYSTPEVYLEELNNKFEELSCE